MGRKALGTGSTAGDVRQRTLSKGGLDAGQNATVGKVARGWAGVKLLTAKEVVCENQEAS